MRYAGLLSILAAAALLGCSADPSSPTVPLPGDPSLARLSDTDHGGRHIATDLNGAEEVPPRATPGTGTFTMTMNQGHAEICYELSVQDLLAPVVAAHIHVAPIGVAGPVVIPLVAPVTGFSKACTTVDAALLKAIRKNPDAYYVNVHTTLFPPGEVRGQLSK